LAQNVDYEYTQMLKEASRGKKYDLLSALAEKWLQVHPHDKTTYEFIAEAANNLQQYEKYGSILEELYRMGPSSALAKEVYLCYKKTENFDRQREWAEKLSKMPEFQSDYMLHFDLVMKYSKDNNLGKAGEYARLTLKCADAATTTHAQAEAQLQQIRRVCHHIIASDLLEKKNFTDAITAYKEALKAERYGEGYYGIGLCLDNLKEIESANLYYAMAELTGGEDAPRAKTRLEALYKALHNNTLVGIDKVYQKAKDSLTEPVK